MVLTLRSYMYKVFTMLATSLVDWKEDDGDKIKTMMLKFLYDYNNCRSIWYPLPCCLQKGWHPSHKGWTCRSYQHGNHK